MKQLLVESYMENYSNAVGFENINKVLIKNLISKLVDISYRKAGLKRQLFLLTN